MALGKEEHPGRVIGAGQDVNVSDYFGHASRRASSSRMHVREDVVNEATKRLKESLKAEIEASIKESLKAERQASKQFIQTLLEERKQYIPDKPLPEMPALSLYTSDLKIPPSGKGSCSTMNDPISASHLDGTRQCRLFWPNKDNEVAEGVVYHSSQDIVMLHNRPLKSGQVKVSIVTPVEAAKGVEVPFPTDEACTVLEDVGQFIAWPIHLVLPIEKEMTNSVAKNLDNLMDMDPTPSILDDFRWILDEFVDNPLRYVKIPKQLFSNDHPEISIGMEHVQIWLDKKEIDMCHVSIYLSYLFETHCEGVSDMFGFLSPSLVSLDGDSLKDRATYIANAMKGNIENRIFFAPYKSGQRWVLLVLNPHCGYAYWIDPLGKGQEMDTDQLIDLSYTFKFTNLQKMKPRKQPLWQIVQCPREQNLIDSGYYILRFIKEIMQRKSVSIPKIWYGKKDNFSESEIDEIRKEWIEYLLRLIF